MLQFVAKRVPVKHLDLDDMNFLRHCDLAKLIRSEDKALSEKALEICKKLLKRPGVTLTILFGEIDLDSRDRFHQWQLRRV